MGSVQYSWKYEAQINKSIFGFIRCFFTRLFGLCLLCFNLCGVCSFIFGDLSTNVLCSCGCFCTHLGSLVFELLYLCKHLGAVLFLLLDVCSCCCLQGCNICLCFIRSFLHFLPKVSNLLDICCLEFSSCFGSCVCFFSCFLCSSCGFGF